MKWNSSAKQTENGEISFHYTQLSQLKNEIHPEPIHQPDLSKKVKMIALTEDYETDIITLFHAAGDFNYRSRWMEGVEVVEEVKHFLPRVGMRCRCILKNGKVNIYSSSYSYRSDRIEFSETDQNEESITWFILEKTAANKTRLTLDFYVKKNIVTQILFNLTRKKEMKDMFDKSLENLHELVKEIKLPAEAI
jgi:hypothetical protein